jgi:hypothetical protein
MLSSVAEEAGMAGATERSERVRARHLLSAYAVVSAAGLLAMVGAGLSIGLAADLAGSRLASLPDDDGATVLPLAGVILGLISLALPAWLPVRRTLRHVVFTAIATTVLSAVQVAAVPASSQTAEDAAWLAVSSAIGVGLFPWTLRGVLRVAAGSARSSVAGARVDSSLGLAILVGVYVSFSAEGVERLATGSAAWFQVGIGAILVLLSAGGWTIGTRPAGVHRPRWFATSGRLLMATLVVFSLALLIVTLA